MATNRSSHVAVLLKDGRVLVAGGELAGGVGNVFTEIFSSSTGLWVTNGNILAVRRFGAAATLLTNGNVIITGGTDSQPIKSVEIFDPVSAVWTNAANMASVRSRHTATLLLDGRVLVTGGQSRSPDQLVLTKSQIYQSSSNIWVNTGNLNTGRYFHSAVRLNDGRVLISGGLNLSGTPVASAEIYDPVTGTWVVTGAMNTPRYRFQMILLTNGTILAHGGSGVSSDLADSEVYDPFTGVWTNTGSMTAQRSVFSSSLLVNGQVLATGGLNSSNAAEIYNPDTSKWTSIVPMVSSRAFQSMTTLTNGKVLVVGGGGNNSTEVFDPDAQSWSPVVLVGEQFLPNGGFQFNFTNFAGSTNTVLKSTNIGVWTPISTALEISPGWFQFTDSQTSNSPHSFYRVRTP